MTPKDFMTRISISICMITIAALLLASGCASQMNTANEGANQAGQTAGGAARVPNSFIEGAAKGTAGQNSPNPYNR
jgi:hypothetical protein